MLNSGIPEKIILFISLLFFLSLLAGCTSIIPINESKNIRTVLSNSHAVGFFGGKGIESIKYADNGNIIISRGSDYCIKIWKSSGQLLHTINIHDNIFSHTETESLAVSPSGKEFAVLQSGNQIYIYSINGNLLKVIKDLEYNYEKIKYSFDGNFLICAGLNGNIEIIDIVNNKSLIVFDSESRVYSNSVFDFDITPDNSFVYGSWNDTIRFYNLAGTLLNEIAIDSNYFYNIDVSTDGEYILARVDDSVKIWGKENKVLYDIKKSLSGYNINFMPDEQLVIGFSKREKDINIFDFTGKIYKTITPDKQISCLDIAPDGNDLIIGFADGSIALYNINDDLYKEFGINPIWATKVAYNNEKNVFAAASRDKLNIWSKNGSLNTPIDTKDVAGIAYNDDGNMLAVISVHGKIELYNNNGNLVNKINDNYDFRATTPICFTPDSKYIINMADEEEIKIWTIDGEHISTIKEEQVSYALAVSPKDFYFVTGNTKGGIKLWSFDGKLLNMFKASDSWIDNIFFMDNGETILTQGRWEDTELKLWNLKGELLSTFNCEEQLTESTVSKDGNLIAGYTIENKIYIFNRNAELLKIIEDHNGGVVYGMNFINENNTIFCFHPNGLCSYIDIAKNETLTVNMLESGDWFVTDEFGYYDSSINNPYLINIINHNKVSGPEEYEEYKVSNLLDNFLNRISDVENMEFSE